MNKRCAALCLHKEGDCFFLESDVEPLPPLVPAVGAWVLVERLLALL